MFNNDESISTNQPMILLISRHFALAQWGYMCPTRRVCAMLQNNKHIVIMFYVKSVPWRLLPTSSSLLRHEHRELLSHRQINKCYLTPLSPKNLSCYHNRLFDKRSPLPRSNVAVECPLLTYGCFVSLFEDRDNTAFTYLHKIDGEGRLRACAIEYKWVRWFPLDGRMNGVSSWLRWCWESWG